VKRLSVFALLAAVVLVAGPALASNTGFKLNYGTAAGLYRGNNLISVPQFYYPDGNKDNAVQDTRAFCTDLKTGNCTMVARITKFTWNGTNNSPTFYTCGAPGGYFNLAQNEGYFVEINADPGTCTLDIVGSANDLYDFVKNPPASGGLQMSLHRTNNFMAVPYHVQAVDTSNLCDSLRDSNPSNTRPTRVTELSATGARFYTCGAPGGMFNLVPGKGYVIEIPATADPYLCQWTTY
jgi:hypothetical protein